MSSRKGGTLAVTGDLDMGPVSTWDIIVMTRIKCKELTATLSLDQVYLFDQKINTNSYYWNKNKGKPDPKVSSVNLTLKVDDSRKKKFVQKTETAGRNAPKGMTKTEWINSIVQSKELNQRIEDYVDITLQEYFNCPVKLTIQ